MKRIWNLDSIQVYVTGVAGTEDLGFEGYAIIAKGRQLHWQAWPRPSGWELDVRCPVSRNGSSVTGTPTLNLGLELSTFIKRSFPLI